MVHGRGIENCWNEKKGERGSCYEVMIRDKVELEGRQRIQWIRKKGRNIDGAERRERGRVRQRTG